MIRVVGLILVIALLLFGKRLPEVGRSLGRGIIEFKKGIKGIENDLNDDIVELFERVEQGTEVYIHE